MKQSVYLETSIISYLASRPSRDLIVAANQQLTLEWWETRAGDFELFVSDIVYDECSAGDTDAAERRVSIIQMITSLSIDQRVDNLVISLLKQRVSTSKSLAGRNSYCRCCSLSNGLLTDLELQAYSQCRNKRSSRTNRV